MLVVDTSAVLEALVARDPPSGLVARLANDGDLHAPHLIDVEVLHALRRLNAGGHLSEERSLDARLDFAALAVIRYPHIGLADRIWALRQNLTACDAAFVALAEELHVPLVTCDKRLGASAGHFATIEVFALPDRGT